MILKNKVYMAFTYRIATARKPQEYKLGIW